MEIQQKHKFMNKTDSCILLQKQKCLLSSVETSFLGQVYK